MCDGCDSDHIAGTAYRLTVWLRRVPATYRLWHGRITGDAEPRRRRGVRRLRGAPPVRKVGGRDPRPDGPGHGGDVLAVGRSGAADRRGLRLRGPRAVVRGQAAPRGTDGRRGSGAPGDGPGRDGGDVPEP